MQRKKFIEAVWRHYRLNGRHTLPWRKTKNPYRILVSEIMLQQTQAPRVIPKYTTWIKRFPSFERLAQAPLKEVLRAWQGLGYNRRAIALKKCAEAVIVAHRGKLPREKSELLQLPGIGPYTASAIRAFAWNLPDVFIETNIRTVFIHSFFHDAAAVADSEIVPLIEKTIDRKNPREWYWALMDYGAHLKKLHGNANKRSKHYAKQTPFKGSNRELRSSLLAFILEHDGTTVPAVIKYAAKKPRTKELVLKNLNALEREGFIEKNGARLRVRV